jgi:arylsulfatase A-like enzyme
MLPIVRGEDTSHRLAFTETGGVEGPNPSPDHANVKAVRDGRWKLIYNSTTNHFELYDLETDPSETKNLYAVEPEKARELWMKMADHL